MGAVAAEMLVERIVTGWQPVEKREIPAPLILRQSVGPLLEREETPSRTMRAVELQFVEE